MPSSKPALNLRNHLNLLYKKNTTKTLIERAKAFFKHLNIFMKHLLSIFCLVLCSLAFSQTPTDTTAVQSIDLVSQTTPQEKRLNFGGYLQVLYSHESSKAAESTDKFLLNHVFLSLKGEAVKEKLSFEVQMDFGLKDPFLDAWIGYHPTKALTLFVGQKQTPLNNRELLLKSSKVSFQDKGLLSTELGASGRELGLYGELILGKKELKLVPQIALTTGDGRNNLGESLGGFKYGARLDFYPLGFFKDQKALSLEDLAHEEKPKILIGTAYSYNKGVSHKTGDGQGAFLLLDSQLNPAYPNYQKLYADVLVKYSGFALFAEYGKSTTLNNELVVKQADGSPLLEPQKQLYSYLALGEAYNLQLSYTFQGGLGLLARYASSSPEFKFMQDSVLKEKTALSFGLNHYFYNHSVKLQAAYSHLDTSSIGSRNRGDLMLKVAF